MNDQVISFGVADAKKTVKNLKILVFSVGNLNVALAIDIVKKVMYQKEIVSSGLNHLGIVNLGDEEITVIDLHKKLFKVSSEINLNQKGYMILAQNSQEEKFVILLDTPPSLMDISLANLRVLPESYRKADTLGIASHVTIIPQESGKMTVFLLDPDQLI